MDIKDFKPANITWILNNIKCIWKLKYFQLNAVLPIGKDVKEFNVCVDFVDIYSTRREFEPIYVVEEGSRVDGSRAGTRMCLSWFPKYTNRLCGML
jgi:hypothetical protein